MSSFMVSKETIFQICAAVQVHGYKYPRMLDSLRGFDVDMEDIVNRYSCMTRTGFSDFGDRLISLNALAISTRYGKCDDELRSTIPWNLGKLSLYSNVTMYKAVQCFLYQCAEGDVPESPLYKWVSEFKNLLAGIIIENMPEYEAARWG